MDVSVGTIDRKLGERQGLRVGIKHLSEPGAVSRTLFFRAGPFCQAVEPLFTVLRFPTLSHRQPLPICPAWVTQEESLGIEGDNLRPEAPVQCLAPGRREETGV